MPHRVKKIVNSQPIGVGYTPKQKEAIKNDIVRLMIEHRNPNNPIARGLPFSHAVVAAGLNLSTAYDWKNDDEVWSERLEAARSKLIETQLDIAEGKLWENIHNNDNTSIIFFMKTQGKARGYIEKTQIEQTITHTIDIAEAARRIHFAMRAAERQGIVIDGIASVVPEPVCIEKRKAKTKNGKAQAKKNTKKALLSHIPTGEV